MAFRGGLGSTPPGLDGPEPTAKPAKDETIIGCCQLAVGPAVDQVSSSAAEFALELELQIAPALYVIWVLVGLLQI